MEINMHGAYSRAVLAEAMNAEIKACLDKFAHIPTVNYVTVECKGGTLGRRFADCTYDIEIKFFMKLDISTRLGATAVNTWVEIFMTDMHSMEILHRLAPVIDHIKSLHRIKFTETTLAFQYNNKAILQVAYGVDGKTREAPEGDGFIASWHYVEEGQLHVVNAQEEIREYVLPVKFHIETLS